MAAQYYSQTMAVNKRMSILSEEEKKMAMKYADLLPEHNQLEKEVQEIRNMLQKAKLKRDNLIGVVRFLRQKRRKLKKISADSKASEMGHVNKSVRSSPHMDQNYEAKTLATIGKEITATAESQYAFKAPTYKENIATQFQRTIVAPIYRKTVALQENQISLRL